MTRQQDKLIKQLGVAAEVARLHDMTKQLITGSFWTRVNLNMYHAMYNNIRHQIDAGAISIYNALAWSQDLRHLEDIVDEGLKHIIESDSYVHINYLRKNDDPNVYKVEQDGYLYYNFKPRGLLYVLQRMNRQVAAIGNGCVFITGDNHSREIIKKAYEKYGIDIEVDIT